MCKKPEAGRPMASLRNRKARAAVRSEERAERPSRGRRGRRALGATLELCPEGTGEPREGPEQGKKLGSRTSLLPFPRSAPTPRPAPLPLGGSLLPSFPGPHAAPRSPRRRPPSPSRPLSSASSQTPPSPSSVRRRDTAHAPRARGRREMESTVRPEPAPTSGCASGLPPSARPRWGALRFRPWSAVP